jgi:pimeloyl-ACP methyl ester carboxylesterase
MRLKTGRWFCAVVVLLLAMGGSLALSWASDRRVESLKGRWAAPDSGSRFMDVRGMAVHLRDEGPVNDLTPIVLLHGTGASLHTWDGWAAELSKTRRVIRMDLPGFGLTGPYAGTWLNQEGGQYSLVNYARFVVATLDALDVKQPVVLAGNSLGGQIAWETADYLKTSAAPSQSKRVAKLILVDSAGYDFKPIEMPKAFEAAEIALLSPITENTLPRFLLARDVRSVYGDPSKVTPELIDRYYELALREGNRRALGLRMREPRAIAPERIANITQPTLILWGGQDRLIPPSNAALFVRDIKGSQLVVFDKLGHVPHEEDAAQTVAAVQTFLAGK